MPKTRSHSRWVSAVALAGVLVAVVWFWRRDRRPPELAPRVTEKADDESPAEPTVVARTKGEEAAPSVAATDAELPPLERYKAHMAETKRALLEKTRYPLGSRPLVTKTDLLKPHHVEPIMRALAADMGQTHTVAIMQNQDRVWLSPGQAAIATITATSNNVPAQLTFQRSDLTQELGADGGNAITQSAPFAHPTFLDDGNPPDELPGDGVYTAAVIVPATVPPSSLTLVVGATATNGETGTLYFNFISTLPPPAVFTQTARDALEAGSIAIYVGISVQQAGSYIINGRLYDSTGLPLVFMNFTGELTTETTEVRLLAFGKVILDEGGVPPFTLQDVDGQEMLIGVYPDRAPMVEWAGPYATQNYSIASLSNADYDGPDKQRKIDALDKATQEGIERISNGGGSQQGAPTAH